MRENGTPPPDIRCQNKLRRREIFLGGAVQETGYMRWKPSVRHRASLAASAIALLLAGCADDDSDRPGTGPATAVTTRAEAAASSSSMGPNTGESQRPVEPAGAITSPAEGASVQQCSYVSGTSAGLPSGRTLILAMRNLDNGDPERYVTYVSGWDEPAGLSSWRGVQYFGSGDSSVGQRYTIELIMTDLKAVRTTERDTPAVNALASRRTVLATRTVVRVAGGTPEDCKAP